MDSEAVPAMAGAARGGIAAGPAATVAPPRGSIRGDGRPKSALKGQSRPPGETRWVAALFLAPAVILLAAILLYPFIWSVVRSLFSDGPAGNVGRFVGLRNFGDIFTDPQAFRAVKNNVIWVLVAPAVLTMLGLVFAVLIERIRWATAFKLVVFMPMSISMVASGVTWGLIYSDQPSRGLGNAIAVGIHDTFSPSTTYPGLRPGTAAPLTTAKAGYLSTTGDGPATAVLLPLVGLNLLHPPSSARQAVLQNAVGLHGVVWNDFKLGGGGTPGQIGPGELGLPGIKVQAVQDGKTVGTATTTANGSFDFPHLTSGTFQLLLPKSNFAANYGGINWLGPDLITPAIIIAFLWVWTGFAMVLIASGMAALPRDALEAARMDGATEWQVFRRVTVPLLAPTLLVVFVTLTINVLKVFDLVYILGQDAGANRVDANVLATQLYNSYSNQQYGVASAIGVFLVLLVMPFMILNIRRFRRDQR
jgi:alpha-glucoside transport system permease protein